MNYIVSVEGQNIPVPEEIGASDESVKNALSGLYPEVANAMITRVAKDDTTTITVVKRAGSKGLTGLDYLKVCPGGKNPAVALYEELQVLDQEDSALKDPVEMLELDARIDGAIREGAEQAQRVEYALKRLTKSASRPAPFVIQGF
jgi:hypothetical protein